MRADATRIDRLLKRAAKRRLDEVLVADPANVEALTGVRSDNAVLRLRPGAQPLVRLYTDFRYVPMVHRVAPDLTVRDIRRLPIEGRRVGYESSLPHARYLEWVRLAPRRATFVDILPDLKDLRAVKTADEIARLRAAERLTVEIWRDVRAKLKPGLTERDIARLIQREMIARGDGESFATIVCIGANAAECHHEPDDTPWNGRDPILVDMGVRLNGVCADLTRNVKPDELSGRRHRRSLYDRVYDLVAEANRTAIAAARPGLTAAQLDRIGRAVIRKGGFGRCFGHSLGHGVGLEIHEAPAVSHRDKTALKPGMTVTIEPGVYLEGNLGVRIEDLILITETGCEVLSAERQTFL